MDRFSVCMEKDPSDIHTDTGVSVSLPGWPAQTGGDVYRTINRKKILFIQAPTGTGKTISTLFPAIRAVGENLGDKIFYLTAKTITRTVAKDTCDLLKAHGYQSKVIVLTAKEKPADRVDDPYLAEKMKKEAESIFLWAFKGLQRLVRQNFKFTEVPVSRRIVKM